MFSRQKSHSKMFAGDLPQGSGAMGRDGLAASVPPGRGAGGSSARAGSTRRRLEYDGGGGTGVSPTAKRPAVYAVPLDSLVVLYAVVVAFNVAALVNSAILNTFPVVVVKLWVPCSSSCLKDVHIDCVIGIIVSLSVLRCLYALGRLRC